MLTDPCVSASIVLYHSGNQALEAVRCLQASTQPVDLFVVDNSPQEVTARAISLQDPDAIILPQQKNLGYGGGHNQVLPRLKSKYHLILNPDVSFPPDLLERMVRFMDDHKDVVMLTPRVFFPDGTEQFLPRRTPTVRYLFGGRLARLGGVFRELRREYTMEGVPMDAPLEVEYATGCFLLVRSHAFYRMGGFDERYFLYHEDSDLSRKALQMGKIVYHPDFCITHNWHRDSSHSGKALRYHLQSTWKYFMKWGWKW